MTYHEYLLSPVWTLLRRQRLAIDNYECVLCGAPAEVVHHRRYPEVLGDENVTDLVSLCRECHERHHGAFPSIKLPPPVPLTEEFKRLRLDIIEAERAGDEERAADLFVHCLNIRRSQVVG